MFSLRPASHYRAFKILTNCEMRSPQMFLSPILNLHALQDMKIVVNQTG